MAVGNSEIREAKEFLESHGLSDVPPRMFVMAAKELGLDFERAIMYLAELLQGGQGLGQAEQTMRALRQGVIQ